MQAGTKKMHNSFRPLGGSVTHFKRGEHRQGYRAIFNPSVLIHIVPLTTDAKLLNAAFTEPFILSPSETQTPAGG